jgi:hypothetical protein
MRKRVEMMAKSTTAKNGHERIVTDRDNMKHLEYFMNGQWKHSENCKEFTNKDCTFKTVSDGKSTLDRIHAYMGKNEGVLNMIVLLLINWSY